jgi:hypothetical protein
MERRERKPREEGRRAKQRKERTDTLIKRVEREKRFLTAEEIDFIVSEIPRVPSGLKRISDLKRRQFVGWLKDVLFDTKVYPETILSIKRYIEKFFERSFIEGGSPVGFFSAESLSAQVTQVSLDAFKSFGAGQVANMAVRLIRELLFLTKKRSNSLSTIFFKSKKSLEQALESRVQIEEVTVANLLDGTPGETFEKFTRDNNWRDPWWYSLYFSYQPEDSTLPSLVNNSRAFFRVHLDKMKLYKHRVTVEQVAEALRKIKSKSARGGKSYLNCVPSPTHIATCDLYLISDKFGKAYAGSVSEKIFAFIQSKIIPLFS